MRRRVLLAIPVFDGRDFVPACVRSAAGLRSGTHRVDVVVLDDCSPEPGWSPELQALCESLDVGYYRSPRNLGIPRNFNLALQRAMSAGYDYVLITNSDTVLPLNLVTGMVGVAEANAGVASVTAWSNNVSAFSIGSNEAGLADQDMVDWLSGHLQEEFGGLGADLPSAVGFCMLIPVPVARRVGLFDPVFGRGYCEEVDWSRRALGLGYRPVLAPSVFVYHEGGASTRAAGILGSELTTLGAHEAIIDLRYADYRQEVADFATADPLAPLRARASRALVLAATRRWGYRIEVTKLPRPLPEPGVPFFLEPDAVDARLVGVFSGFALEVPLTGGDVATDVVTLLGHPPRKVIVLDHGPNADRVAAADWDESVIVEDLCVYPQRV
jgi:GT2 family glycosyltransferase